jgi:hypothetical protein
MAVLTNEEDRMGRASRRTRERRALHLEEPEHKPPGWSVYAHCWRVLAMIEREALKRGGKKEDSGNLLERLRHAHVVYVDPLQAAAAPREEPFSDDQMPFPIILLATGEESGDRGSPPYATLITDWRYSANEEDMVILLPIYRAPRLLDFEGMAILWKGRVLGSSFIRILDEARANGNEVTEDMLRPDEHTMRGASIALASLELLKSVNVELETRPSAPKAHRAHGVPMSEVVIRQRHMNHRSVVSHAVEWSHRWEVRGHYKHFTKGPIFDANPDRHIEVDGVECVRLWCPPFVKGPEDKPLVPKVRRVSREITMPAGL